MKLKKKFYQLIQIFFDHFDWKRHERENETYIYFLFSRKLHIICNTNKSSFNKYDMTFNFRKTFSECTLMLIDLNIQTFFFFFCYASRLGCKLCWWLWLHHLNSTRFSWNSTILSLNLNLNDFTIINGLRYFQINLIKNHRYCMTTFSKKL